MIPISPTLIKYGAIAIIVVVLFGGAYYKGVNDTRLKYELEIKQAQIELANAITKVEQQSNSIADAINANTGITNQKLDNILATSRGKKLTSVPCTPSQDFISAWSEFNATTK
jgi:hypothetical protein